MSLKTRVKAFMAADKPPVATELGATGTSVFAGLLYEEDYNSDLQGEKALKVYDKMRKSDGQVKAGLLACKLPLMVARWDMTPASQEEQDVEIAGMVKDDLFENMTITWDDFLRQALIMLDFGHMAFEKVWVLRDGRYTWQKLAPRLPQSIAEWHVKDDGDLDFIIQQANIGTQFKRITMPSDKLLIFSHEKEGSNFRGISLLRAAYKHWWYKNNLYAIDGIAAERHGVGLADFTYPDQATDAQKAAVKEVGERLHAHERAYTAHPESIKFDLKGVQGQLHDIKGSIDHHDLQIVRSILAQFMNLGAKSTGSYALSQDQSQFFLMALQAVGKNVCNTVNRNCIREMVDYNWDVKKYPHLTVSGLDSPDILAYAGAIAQLMTAGAITNDIPTENELRRMVKLPQKQTVVPALPKDMTKDETAQPTQPVPAGQVGEKGDTAENIVEGAKLNGIQITASLEVLNDLIAKSIPPEVALELLVAVGIDRDKAQKMVDSCKAFNPAQPPPSETKLLKATDKLMAYSPDQERDEEGKWEETGAGEDGKQIEPVGNKPANGKPTGGRFAPQESELLDSWATGEKLSAIRDSQRSGIETPETRAFSAALDKADKYDGVAYRGSMMTRDELSKVVKGKSLTLRADSSASASAAVADAFVGFKETGNQVPVMMELKATTAADVRGIGKFAVADQEEVILRKGTRYKVSGVTREGGVFRIKGVEIK